MWPINPVSGINVPLRLYSVDLVTVVDNMADMVECLVDY